MISEEEVKSITIAMKNRYGIDFTNYEPKSLTRGFKRLMTKHQMNGMMDLWSKILRDEVFCSSAIDELMVNLTELFRNPEAWIKLKDDILLKFKDKHQIRIWHAGCATGEEVYSLIIVLDQLNLLSKSKIIATDLSSKALSKAKEGKYSNNIMKNYLTPFMQIFPDKKIEDYFTTQGNDYVIKPKYLQKIEYRLDNLIEMEMNEKFDIIFCRNVMIYFDIELKNRVLKFLTNHLHDEGHLVLGYYDTIPHKSIDTLNMTNNKTRIYQKQLV